MSRPPPSAFHQAFRPPFQSPASRPSSGSSIWSPPSYHRDSPHPSPSSSAFALPISLPKPKPPAPSTLLLAKLTPDDKPWLTESDPRTRVAWWLTLISLLLGLAAAAALCWLGTRTVQKLDNAHLCSVFQDDFSTLDTQNIWSRDVQLGGFGNGQFQITTDSSNNSYTKNNNLYILPTLTSDALGPDRVLANGSYTVPGCTSTNKTACTAHSDGRTSAINPVMSARLSTKGKASIKFGKVEVRAKLPRGDWLWPSIRMLPVDDTYGSWPLSGEIDIMQSKGNPPPYPGGTSTVHSALTYGPLLSLVHSLAGWSSMKRKRYDTGWHTYGIEWAPDFVRVYVDSRIKSVLDLRIRGGKSGGSAGHGWFWRAGGFPATAVNGSEVEVVVRDVWSAGGVAAPFDQAFYLGIDLAAGGTSGWFPDGVGGKPWHDGSLTAMRDFALAQSEWAATWPGEDDLAFRVEYVKMWQLC